LPAVDAKPPAAESPSGPAWCLPAGGGIYGCYQLLDAAADPTHPEHERAQEILPPDHDPAHFDLDWTNRRISDPANHLVLLDTT
jgi:hypothetical protein